MQTKCCCACCSQVPLQTNNSNVHNPQPDTFTTPCRNYYLRCPCTSRTAVSLSNPTQLPLRAMQKALVAKYTELEKLGQLAHDHWCQRRALQQLLQCHRQNKCCRQEEYSRVGQQNNQLQVYDPSVSGTYTGTLKIRDADGCTCNHTDKTSTYSGVVRMHDQNQLRTPDYTYQLDKLQTEQELSQLSSGLAEAIQREQETQQQLQNVRTELACLQSKIKSFWGDNALDKCTPAKENRTKFF